MRSTARATPSVRVSPLLVFTGLAVLFCVLGVLFVFEASVSESHTMVGHPYHFVRQHLLGLALGLVAALVGFFTPPRLWITWSPVLFGGAVLLLIMVLIPGIGLELNGAHRWLSLGPLTFQPVELAKFAVVAFYTRWMSSHQRIKPFLFLTGLLAVLVMLQPDLGSLLILGGIACSMFFLAGGNNKQLLVAGAGVIPILLLLIVFSPYRWQRVQTFLNPESDPLGASYHFRQITLALGRGGVLGQGIGNSRQRFSFIPEASTDSIFAIIAEEVGYVGSAVLLFLFVLFFWLGYRNMLQADVTEPERLLGFGLLAWLSLQVLLNLSAVVGLVPLTGIPLPFFSYGRTSQVMILFATGILIRIAYKRITKP